MNVENFYRLTHFGASFIIGTILMYLWLNYILKSETKRLRENRDYGLILLSLAIFLWGTISLMNYQYCDSDNTDHNNLFSILNNILFLCAFPFFDHGYRFLKKHRNSYLWLIILVGIGAIFLIASWVLSNEFPDKKDNWISKIPSILLTTLTSLLLAQLLYNSFKERGYRFLGYLSYAIMIVILLPQYGLLHESIDIFFNNYDEVIYLVSWIGFASILVALGFSWLNEKNQVLLSNIFIDENDEKQEEIARGEIKEKDIRENWVNFLANDKIEDIIEEALLLKQMKGANLSLIINIAARNSRNNTAKALDVITKEEFDIERNKILEILTGNMKIKGFLIKKV